MNVTVYSKPNCVQCNWVKKFMDNNGIEHTVIDITENAEAYKVVTQTLGYKAAPVVSWDSPTEGYTHFSGFNPYKLDDIKDAHVATAA